MAGFLNNQEVIFTVLEFCQTVVYIFACVYIFAKLLLQKTCAQFEKYFQFQQDARFVLEYDFIASPWLFW